MHRLKVCQPPRQMKHRYITPLRLQGRQSVRAAIAMTVASRVLATLPAAAAKHRVGALGADALLQQVAEPTPRPGASS
eukprot:354591-Chlamydomonas_euryale.AAC.1